MVKEHLEVLKNIAHEVEQDLAVDPISAAGQGGQIISGYHSKIVHELEELRRIIRDSQEKDITPEAEILKHQVIDKMDND